VTDLSIWGLCDDPDGVAGAIAAADQYKAALRDSPLEKVRSMACDPTLHHFARMLAVREVQRREEALSNG
jgi:hypothetical protein